MERRNRCISRRYRANRRRLDHEYRISNFRVCFKQYPFRTPRFRLMRQQVQLHSMRPSNVPETVSTGVALTFPSCNFLSYLFTNLSNLSRCAGCKSLFTTLTFQKELTFPSKMTAQFKELKAKQNKKGYSCTNMTCISIADNMHAQSNVFLKYPGFKHRFPNRPISY